MSEENGGQAMKELLTDIRARLLKGDYRNEEHVRLALVARVLQGLGWNIWDPQEVNEEYVVVPNEDKTRVDIALFLRLSLPPAVFMEIKSIGQIQGNLPEIEKQMRNYNRDNQAMFTVITDGREWRFYYSQAGGEFSRRCFETFHLADDDLDEIEESLMTFLRRSEIENENAKRDAEDRIRMTEIDRIVRTCLAEARRKINQPPFPSLPEALIQLAQQQRCPLTREQAIAIIQKEDQLEVAANPPATTVRTPNSATPCHQPPDSHPQQVRMLNPDTPENLTFTRIIEGHFNERSVANWNDLVDCAIRTAQRKGLSFQEVKNIFTAMTEGTKTNQGYHPISGTEPIWSVQGMNTKNAWEKSLRLARKTRVEITVRLRWGNNPNAAHRGEEALLQWSPSR